MSQPVPASRGCAEAAVPESTTRSMDCISFCEVVCFITRVPSGRSFKRSASMVGGSITPPLPIDWMKRETESGVTSTGPCPMAICPHSCWLKRCRRRMREGGGVMRSAHASFSVFQKPFSAAEGGPSE
jgi:hypothetical protein